MYIDILQFENLLLFTHFAYSHCSGLRALRIGVVNNGIKVCADIGSLLAAGREKEIRQVKPPDNGSQSSQVCQIAEVDGLGIRCRRSESKTNVKKAGDHPLINTRKFFRCGAVTIKKTLVGYYGEDVTTFSGATHLVRPPSCVGLQRGSGSADGGTAGLNSTEVFCYKLYFSAVRCNVFESFDDLQKPKTI